VNVTPTYEVRIGNININVDVEREENEVIINTPYGKLKGRLEYVDKDHKLFKLIIDGVAYTIKYSGDKLVFIGGEPLAIEGLRMVIASKLKRERGKAPNPINREHKHVNDKVYTSPIAGKVISVNVNDGKHVSKGDVLLLIESMKMVNEIRAPRSGVIKKVHVRPGDNIRKGDVLVEFE